MTLHHRLVVALTGGDGDETVIRYADALTHLHARAGAVRNDDYAMQAVEGAAPQATLALQERDDLALAAPQVVEYERLNSRRPVEHLLDVAETRDIAAILVGNAMTRRQLRNLVRRSPCSVWFVPDGAPPLIGRILVPVDFSLRSADCLRVATRLAHLSPGAECLALHVWFNESPFAGPPHDRAALARLGESYSRFVTPIDMLGVRVAPIFHESANVPRAINHVANDWKADLIVASSRGRTWAAALLHESTAGQVLRDCRVPFLVVKHFGRQVGLLRLLREPVVVRRGAPRFN